VNRPQCLLWVILRPNRAHDQGLLVGLLCPQELPCSWASAASRLTISWAFSTAARPAASAECSGYPPLPRAPAASGRPWDWPGLEIFRDLGLACETSERFQDRYPPGGEQVIPRRRCGNHRVARCRTRPVATRLGNSTRPTAGPRRRPRDMPIACWTGSRGTPPICAKNQRDRRPDAGRPARPQPNAVSGDPYRGSARAGPELSVAATGLVGPPRDPSRPALAHRRLDPPVSGPRRRLRTSRLEVPKYGAQPPNRRHAGMTHGKARSPSDALPLGRTDPQHRVKSMSLVGTHHPWQAV
jgi:hypothetical protein